MEIQNGKEAFHNATRKEAIATLSNAIIDFDTKRLFCSNGQVLLSKPLEYQEMDYRKHQGYKIIDKEVLQICSGKQVDIRAMGVEVPSLKAKFEFVKPEVDEKGVEKEVPDISTMIDEMKDYKPEHVLFFDVSSIKKLLAGLGHSSIAIHIFKDEKNGDTMRKVIVTSMDMDPKDSVGLIMQKEGGMRKISYDYFQNNLVSEIQSRVDIEAEHEDFKHELKEEIKEFTKKKGKNG